MKKINQKHRAIGVGRGKEERRVQRRTGIIVLKFAEQLRSMRTLKRFSEFDNVI